MLTPGRRSRLGLGRVGAADGVAPVATKHARELRVVKLRPPHRFSNGGAGSGCCVPPRIPTVCAAGSIRHTRNCAGRCVDTGRLAGYTIDCGPDGQTERCGEKHAPEHAAIVARSRVLGQTSRGERRSTVCDALAATFEGPLDSGLAELSSVRFSSLCR